MGFGLFAVVVVLVFIVVNRVLVKIAVFISPSLFSSICAKLFYIITKPPFQPSASVSKLNWYSGASSSFGASCKKIVFKSKGHFRARQVFFIYIPVA